AGPPARWRSATLSLPFCWWPRRTGGLHACPTRRASDLPPTRTGGRERPTSTGGRERPTSTGGRERLRRAGGGPHEDGRAAAVPRSEEHTLNSSHVKNSYAVFCLTKKSNHGCETFSDPEY